MASYHIEDISEALRSKKFPTTLMWNRLEGRPRTHNFDRAMKAEVRDALWMITKQWQMGEYQGDDAGSPVFAKLHITSAYLSEYKAAKHIAQPYEKNIPLEAKAEQKRIPFERKGQKISLDIRLQMGNFWLKLLKSDTLPFASLYVQNYSFKMPINERSQESTFAHQEVWKTVSAISGRSIDGYELYEKLKNGILASDGITNTEPGKTKLDNLGEKFVHWYENLFIQPIDENNDAWLPDQLEYQFECDASSDTENKILKADEYYHGHLDWYAFNIERKPPKNGGISKDKFTDTFIPSHVQFEGMPDTRWWKFEDSKTSFGDVKPSTADLGKLLLIEFGLVFANDWFIVPFKLPVGSLANVEGLSVKNNFGETIWIKATEEESEANSVWSMFKMKSIQQDNTLFLAPAAIKTQDGNALEEIMMIRDEVSNMVWGIEQTIPLRTGLGDRGAEAGLRVRTFHENKVNQNKIPEYVPYAAHIYYKAMTQVPEHWIPFIAVHIDADNREVQLQRASMLRVIEGDTLSPEKIKPNTSVLREGLDTSTQEAYYIHEEEVPKQGIKVSQSFQRTRWMNGEVFVWLGMQKQTGRGEGSSGLVYDKIENA